MPIVHPSDYTSYVDSSMEGRCCCAAYTCRRLGVSVEPPWLRPAYNKYGGRKYLG